MVAVSSNELDCSSDFVLAELTSTTCMCVCANANDHKHSIYILVGIKIKIGTSTTGSISLYPGPHGQKRVQIIISRVTEQPVYADKPVAGAHVQCTCVYNA